MSNCKRCDALRKVAPVILSYEAPDEDILCGYHAKELKKENELLRDELDEIGIIVGEFSKRKL